MDNIEVRYNQWCNGELSNSELLMHTMIIRRRLFEIETELLNTLRTSEDQIADERAKRLGV